MSVEAMVMTHAAVFIAAMAGTLGYVRHVAGWKTAFETTISADIAHIKHVLGIHTGQAAPPIAPRPRWYSLPRYRGRPFPPRPHEAFRWIGPI
jgi:hypothetical protein